MGIGSDATWLPSSLLRGLSPPDLDIKRGNQKRGVVIATVARLFVAAAAARDALQGCGQSEIG